MGCLDVFISPILSLVSPSLWEVVRYRLKYFVKRPLNPFITIQQNDLLTPTVVVKIQIKNIQLCIVLWCNGLIKGFYMDSQGSAPAESKP